MADSDRASLLASTSQADFGSFDNDDEPNPLESVDREVNTKCSAIMYRVSRDIFAAIDEDNLDGFAAALSNRQEKSVFLILLEWGFFPSEDEEDQCVSIYRKLLEPMMERCNHDLMTDTIDIRMQMMKQVMDLDESGRSIFMVHQDGLRAFDDMMHCGSFRALDLFFSFFVKERKVKLPSGVMDAQIRMELPRVQRAIVQQVEDGIDREVLSPFHRVVRGNGTGAERQTIITMLCTRFLLNPDTLSWKKSPEQPPPIESQTSAAPEVQTAEQKEESPEPVNIDAALFGDAKESLKPMLQLRDAERGPILSTSPLQDAVRRGDMESCVALLNCGALVDYADHFGWTALFHLFDKMPPNTIEIGQLLLQAGASPHVVDSVGMTIPALLVHPGLRTAQTMDADLCVNRYTAYVHLMNYYSKLENGDALEYASESARHAAKKREEEGSGNPDVLDALRCFVQQTVAIEHSDEEQADKPDATLPGNELRSRTTAGKIYKQITLPSKRGFDTKGWKYSPGVRGQTGSALVWLKQLDVSQQEIPHEIRISFSTGFQADDIHGLYRSMNNPFYALEGVTFVFRMADYFIHHGLMVAERDGKTVANPDFVLAPGTRVISDATRMFKPMFWLPSEDFRNVDTSLDPSCASIPDHAFSYVLYHNGRACPWIVSGIPYVMPDDDDTIVMPDNLFEGIDKTDVDAVNARIKERVTSFKRIRLQVVFAFRFDHIKTFGSAIAHSKQARLDLEEVITRSGSEIPRSHEDDHCSNDEDEDTAAIGKCDKATSESQSCCEDSNASNGVL